MIVNAANPSLLGGGGVDGAIHRAAGPALLAACKQVLQQQGECPPGHAVITIAGNLPASAVIHTVGPVWHGGDRMEAQTLADAYKNSLQLASANNYRSIAFIVTNKLGSQGTVLGGGRYDNLLKELGDKDIPAVGFATGVERIMMLLGPIHTKLLVLRPP